ncbi:MAG TPA: hypothetical protein VMS98_08750 [Thermoanaerobaculia bacterium]|nr:hypothetical protein [Thermoanaerobaculia bacterium]
MSERHCTNCRAELPRGADACPQCGVFAGDVFDGRRPKPPRKPIAALPLILLVLAGAGGWWWYTQHQRRAQIPPMDSGSPGVVSQRPGGTRRATGAEINEAEAIRILRRSLSGRVSAECLVVSSQGSEGGDYRLTAFDRCQNTRLGRFTVDGKSGKVTPGGMSSD